MINSSIEINSFQLPLAVYIHKNMATEEFNNVSILKTISVKSVQSSWLVNLDINPSFKPSHFYVEDEIWDLMNSESLLGPLSASLLHKVVAGQLHSKKQAEVVWQASEIEGEMLTALFVLDY